jgi:hypothetical protein
MKMERIESSETSAYKKQTPGNHPKRKLTTSFSRFVKFGKNKITTKTLLNHFHASELWIHCAPHTWKEQEHFGH